MPAHPQDDFRYTELDPELLSTPFRIHTNWHVVGRQYFEAEIAKGRTIGEIREDLAATTHQIYELWQKF